MARPRRDYLADTATMVQDWAVWRLKVYEQSSIGYPHRTAEASAGEGKGSNKPSANIPDVWMTRSVRLIDRAIEDIPPDLYDHIKRKYFDKEDVSRHKMDQALIWLSARIR